MAPPKVIRVQDIREDQSGTISPTLRHLIPAGNLLGSGESSSDTPDAASPPENSGTEDAENRERKRSRQPNGGAGDREDSHGTDNDNRKTDAEGNQLSTRKRTRVTGKERPRSCLYSAVTLACVRKATGHLESLQRIIAEWFQHELARRESRRRTADSTAKSSPTPVAEANQPRARDSGPPTVRDSVQSHEARVSARKVSTSVLTDTGDSAATTKTRTTKTHDGASCKIPYLEAEDVINETLSLLAKLETDRRKTKRRYEEQIDIVTQMRNELHNRSVVRLKKTPVFVQEEYDAVVENMYSLRWEIWRAEYRETKVLKQLQINSRIILKDEVKKLKEETVVMQEKLDLELANTVRIRIMQKENEDALVETKLRHIETEQKLSEAVAMAEKERDNLSEELENARHAVSRSLEELWAARMAFDVFLQVEDDLKAAITTNDLEIKGLHVALVEAQTAEENIGTELMILETKFEPLLQEYHNLTQENNQAAEELQTQKDEHSPILKEIMKDHDRERENLLRLKSEQRKSFESYEIAQAELRAYSVRKVSMEKRLSHIQSECKRLTDMQDYAENEHRHALKSKFILAARLEGQRIKILKAEQGYKLTADTLARRVQEEKRLKKDLDIWIVSAGMERQSTCEGLKRQRSETNWLKLFTNLRVAEAEKEVQTRLHRNAVRLRRIKLMSEDLETKRQVAKATKDLKSRLKKMAPMDHELKLKLEYLEDRIRDLIQDIKDIDEKRRDIVVRKFCRMIAKKRKEEARVSASGISLESDGSARQGDEEITGETPGGHVSISPESEESTEDIIAFPPRKESTPVEPTGEQASISPETDEKQVGVELQRTRSSCLRFKSRLRSEIGMLDKQLGHLTWKTDLLTTKMEELGEENNAAAAELRALQLDVKLLTEERDEAQTQLLTTRRLGHGLRQQYDDLVTRMKTAAIQHQAFLCDRDQALESQQNQTALQLAKNKDLASRYRQLQQLVPVTKEKLYRMYDEWNRLEYNLKDVKQLHGMQARMWRQLSKCGELLDLHLKKQMHDLQEAPSKHADVVREVLLDMEEAVSHVTRFLQTEEDEGRAGGVARKSMDSAGQPSRDPTEKESHSEVPLCQETDV